MLHGDVYGEEFCYHELPEKLDVFDTDAYCANPMEFYVTCTNVKNGEPVYHRCDRGDGGTADSIPVRYFESIGYKQNVVILTQPEGFVKQPNRFLPLMRIALRKSPALLHALEIRHTKYNETLAYIKEQEAVGNLLVIRPESILEIGVVERRPEELERVYQLGRREGVKRLREVQDFLRRK